MQISLQLLIGLTDTCDMLHSHVCVVVVNVVWLQHAHGLTCE